jgi:subtilisin family serine protease
MYTPKALASIALLLQGAGALRKIKRGNHKVAGVPVYHYHARHMQQSDLEAASNGVYSWVLKFQDNLEDNLLEEFCGGECTVMGHPGRGGVPFATVTGPEGKLQEMLERLPGLVDFIEPDMSVDIEPQPTVLEESSSAAAPWSHETIGLSDAKFTGKGVHIYVMDTGVRTTHTDFEGRAIPTIDTVKGGGKVHECDPTDTDCAADTHGHGTHVAGTAGGAKYGVAKEATLHAMKVCCGMGSNIYGGLDWIAVKAEQPAIMTMSLGSYSTPEASRVAVDKVVDSGVTVVVSAGNANYNSCMKSYTFIASALGVGAMGSNNARASFSNYGTCNAIFAPGVSIVSASHRSDDGSATMSGTSMAAPLTAGAAALLLEEDSSLTPAQIRSTLRSRAKKGVLTGLKQGDPNMLVYVG